MILVFDESASHDLSQLGRWITDRGGKETADAYVRRLRAACDNLVDFPYRGTPRDRLTRGLRSITFERRVIVFYKIEPDCVRIVRLISTARDVSAQFGRD